MKLRLLANIIVILVLATACSQPHPGTPSADPGLRGSSEPFENTPPQQNDKEKEPEADKKTEKEGEAPVEKEPVKDQKPENVVNVKDEPFLAKGDGVTDDGPAIQKALDFIAGLEGGGKVFVPAGNYFTHRDLLIGNNIEIYGEGEKTVFLRSSEFAYSPEYFWEGDHCNETAYFKGRDLFRNKNYNCGNENISMHDFTIDGSKVVSSDPSISSAPTLGFSSLKNVKIENILIKNTFQDAIYIKGGGQNLVIRNVTIDGALMRWYNGSYINIEYHPGARYYTNKENPVIFENNTILLRSPKFCSGEIKMCSSDNDCVAGNKCGYVSEISGIGVTKGSEYLDSPNFPHVIIRSNKISVGNLHKAIACHFCTDSKILDNEITVLSSESVTDGRFRGIFITNSSELEVSGNKIMGSGQAGDLEAANISGNNGSNLLVSKNIFSNKNFTGSAVRVAVIIKGYLNIKFIENVIENIRAVQPPGPGPKQHVNGLIVGEGPPCKSKAAGSVIISANTFHLPDFDSKKFDVPVVTKNVKLVNNVEKDNVIIPPKAILWNMCPAE